MTGGAQLSGFWVAALSCPLVGLKVARQPRVSCKPYWLLDADGASCMLRSHISPEVVFMYLSEEVATLCLRAAAEPDPKKLLELTERINQLLAEQEKKEPRTRKKAAGA